MSDKVNYLSVQGERFFTRLIMVVDDYGRFFADARLLKANLFPLLLDSIRDADISRWMAECQKAGLIVVYEIEGKQYLQIQDFNQRLRQMKEKFPAPPVTCQSNDGQLTAKKRNETETKGREVARTHEGTHDLKNSYLFRQPNIPTKQQVLEAFVNAGGTKEMAQAFWQKHEGTGWFINGSPITNFVALANKFVANWNRNADKVGRSQPLSSAPPLKRLPDV